MTVLIVVTGVVQGVGYRPFVARHAREMNISGTVMNAGGIVQITANGEKEEISKFMNFLETNQPCGACVTKILKTTADDCIYDGFKIIPSESVSPQIPMIPPDLPMCEECKKELNDPENRRYRYPFISCAVCGPRYTIINSLPYDRENTVLNDFEMCSKCRDEYLDGNNIRCHAQTISCKDCGPQLILRTSGFVCEKEEALQKAIELLRSGKILAVKGIGGYQFVCLPDCPEAVEKLRLLKRRDKKPFAVMFPDLEKVKEYCFVNSQEESLLLSAARPIVLLNKKSDNFYFGVCGESRFTGSFLPYTPLHQLLTDACGPLVMTSGNLTSEPIIINDDDMLGLVSPYLSGVLYSLRRIVTPMDDSVARIILGKPQLIRRSRGYAPLPVKLKNSTKHTILAMGGDLKSSFCFYIKERAYVSQYFGDMENYLVSLVYKENITRMIEIFGIKPDIIVCDLHPRYITSGIAEHNAVIKNIKKIEIQHHHAHAASVMAEYNLSSCIGVVFDGTGYGLDGAVWGGEFLYCRDILFSRKAHLDYVKLCGGDNTAKNAEIVSLCYMYAAGEKVENSGYSTINSALANNINTADSSSMGRLFDAVSAVLKIKSFNSYEGECAIALENMAAAFETEGGKPYPINFKLNYANGEILVDQVSLLKDIYAAYTNGGDKRSLALGFHYAVSGMVLVVCEKIREESGERIVALSGGVFSNSLLTQDCAKKLGNAGFTVYTNSAVPVNDSGICLGQAWLCRNI